MCIAPRSFLAASVVGCPGLPCSADSQRPFFRWLEQEANASRSQLADAVVRSVAAAGAPPLRRKEPQQQQKGAAGGRRCRQHTAVATRNAATVNIRKIGINDNNNNIRSNTITLHIENIVTAKVCNTSFVRSSQDLCAVGEKAVEALKQVSNSDSSGDWVCSRRRGPDDGDARLIAANPRHGAERGRRCVRTTTQLSADAVAASYSRKSRPERQQLQQQQQRRRQRKQEHQRTNHQEENTSIKTSIATMHVAAARTAVDSPAIAVPASTAFSEARNKIVITKLKFTSRQQKVDLANEQNSQQHSKKLQMLQIQMLCQVSLAINIFVVSVVRYRCQHSIYNSSNKVSRRFSELVLRYILTSG